MIEWIFLIIVALWLLTDCSCSYSTYRKNKPHMITLVNPLIDRKRMREIRLGIQPIIIMGEVR